MSDFLFVVVKSYLVSPIRLECIQRKALFLLCFKVCIDHLLLITLSLEKRNDKLFWKNVLKVILNFGFKNLYEP